MEQGMGSSSSDDRDVGNGNFGHHDASSDHHPHHQMAWPRSYQGEGSAFLRYYDRFVAVTGATPPASATTSTTDDTKWQCISPMTRHVFPTSGLSPQQYNHQERYERLHEISSLTVPSLARMRRRRSQSLGDYVGGGTDNEVARRIPTTDGENNPPSDPGLVHQYERKGSGTSSTTTILHDNHGYDVETTTTITADLTPPQPTTTTWPCRQDGSRRTIINGHRMEQEVVNVVSEYYHDKRRDDDQQFINKQFGNGNDDDDDEVDDGNTKAIGSSIINNNKDDNDDGRENSFYISLLYGMINATIVLPVVMSFGNIIYRDDAFIPYMPVLIKLTLVSGMVHQLCFSSLSSLKFAVGSVQDAGLIFLSSMAGDMVLYCQSRGYGDDVILATVTVGLAVATTLLGVGLMVIGKLGLARYVQMLPTCVVAGYLAYIGWFVGYSGLGIMAGASTLTLPMLWENILHIVPGVAGGIFIYASVQTYRHVAVLPVCIFLLLLVFYVGLAVTGSSIDGATENGWIRKTDPAPAISHTWDYLQFDKVAWSAMPELWLTWTGMLFVVALSSSLDVAAIELELKRPLDYNRELKMVGMSNLVSGMTGGYTGSYIFSQSIFSLRIGIRSRMAGFALAFFQFLVIIIPVPVLCYVPNFFYGSLLLMICMDLMYEWLWELRRKVTMAEYVIALSTFALIHTTGVEYGILAGVVLYVGCRQLRINVGELKQIPTQDDLIEAATAAAEVGGSLVGTQLEGEDAIIDMPGLVKQSHEENVRLVQSVTNRDSYATF